MTTCNPDMLTAFVDGALGPKDAQGVVAHLAACPACAALVRDHQTLKSCVAGHALSVGVPAGLSARIGSALDKMPPPSRGMKLPRWRGMGLHVGVAALVATASLLLSRPLWNPAPVNIQALMWHHRDAMHAPANLSLATTSAEAGRRWISGRTHQESMAPPLRLPLRGVGVCRMDDDDAAIWMYKGAKPVSLIEIYGRKAPPNWGPPTPGGLRTGSYGGYNAVVWQCEGHTFALVSEMPASQLLRLMDPCR